MGTVLLLYAYSWKSYSHFKSQEHADDQEKERVFMRRERNKMAATKCRNKKKYKLNTLVSKSEAIEKSNNSLRQEMYRLEAEKRHLVRLLMMRRNGIENKSDSDMSVKLSDEFENTSQSNLDIYSVIENFTSSSWIILCYLIKIYCLKDFEDFFCKYILQLWSRFNM